MQANDTARPTFAIRGEVFRDAKLLVLKAPRRALKHVLETADMVIRSLTAKRGGTPLDLGFSGDAAAACRAIGAGGDRDDQGLRHSTSSPSHWRRCRRGRNPIFRQSEPPALLKVRTAIEATAY